MIRLLFIGDVHYRGNNPRARIDDFPATMRTKLRECWNIASANQCLAVLCAGDLFDRPDPDYAVAGELAGVLAECPIPFYSVAGNHEIYGYSQSTVPRTALGLLARIGAVKLLSREPTAIEDADGWSVYLTGQGYHGDIDRSQADYQTGLGPDLTAGYKVHVVHGMLVEKPLPYEAPHTLIKDLATDADVILAGHEHLGFGHTMAGKSATLCCNPGALGRVNAKIEEIYRPVQVALLTFTDSLSAVELLPLTCARPGSEVLSRDYLTQQAEREDRTAAFLSLLASEGEARFLSTREIIDDIARRECLPLPVIQDALKRIGESREQLGKGA